VDEEQAANQSGSSSSAVLIRGLFIVYGPGWPGPQVVN
jgi:hypothetical protein